jgi:hypothetical protein
VHYGPRGVGLRRGRATSIEVSYRTVTLDTGAAVRWDTLRVATGSSRRRPPIPGIDCAGVHHCWTLKDARSSTIFSETLGQCGPDAGTLRLAGGTYTLTVQAPGSSTGTYGFVLVTPDSARTFELEPDQAVSNGVPFAGAAGAGAAAAAGAGSCTGAAAAGAGAGAGSSSVAGSSSSSMPVISLMSGAWYGSAGVSTASLPGPPPPQAAARNSTEARARSVMARR